MSVNDWGGEKESVKSIVITMYYDWTYDTLTYIYIFPWYSSAKTSYLYKKKMMTVGDDDENFIKKIDNDDIINSSARQTQSSSVIKFLSSSSLNICRYLFALSIYISSLITIFSRNKEFFNPELGHHAYHSTYTLWSILQKIAKWICFQLIACKSNSSISFFLFDYSITYVLLFDCSITKSI
jgi:hypothetical protein